MVSRDPQAAIDFISRIRSGAPTALPAPVPSDKAGQIATISQACEPERINALIEVGKKVKSPPTKSPATLFEDAWEGVSKDWVSPLLGPGVAFLGIVVGLLVLARLGALMPGQAPDKVSRRHQRTLFWSGLGLVTAGAGIFTVALAHAETSIDFGDAFRPIFVPVTAICGIFAAIACLGTLLFASALASRLRLNIEVHDSEGKPNLAATGQLISLLSELGGKPSTGLEVPRATDVTAFKDAALITTPDQKIIALLHQLVQFIFNATPWSVVVDGNDDAISVSMTRNGHAVDPVFIRRDELLGHELALASAEDGITAAAGSSQQPTAPSLYKLAAAFTLATLATKHGGFEGLCDARDWRSIGLHYIATTDYGTKDERAVQLLSTAMDLDPKNRAADVALHHELFRFSNKKENLLFYALWLKTQEIFTRIDRAPDVKYDLLPTVGQPTDVPGNNPRIVQPITSQANNTRPGFRVQFRQVLISGRQRVIPSLQPRKYPHKRRSPGSRGSWMSLEGGFLKIPVRYPEPVGDKSGREF